MKLSEFYQHWNVAKAETDHDHRLPDLDATGDRPSGTAVKDVHTRMLLSIRRDGETVTDVSMMMMQAWAGDIVAFDDVGAVQRSAVLALVGAAAPGLTVEERLGVLGDLRIGDLSLTDPEQMVGRTSRHGVGFEFRMLLGDGGIQGATFTATLPQ